jgi:hypothetical protein
MVTELEIGRRELVLGGKSFGDAGPYEKIVGTMRYAVDPEHPLHRQITDIQLAERNAQGHVEFAGDFYLLKPAEPGKGNRRLLWDVPNRGRKSSLGLFNSTPRSPDPTTDQDFGNGFLLSVVTIFISLPSPRSTMLKRFAHVSSTKSTS